MNAPSAPMGPPWIRPEIQQKVAFRDGDVVISVPPKSGTTWTMNIVHQLLSGGTDDFRDIYEEVPWMEFVERPDQTDAEILDRIEAMPHGRRRAFKTHAAPPMLPYIDEGPGNPSVRYVVICRNPEEALVSFWPFLANHSDEWGALWGMPPGAMARPDFATFYEEIAKGMDFHADAFFGFLAAWLPYRNRDNVLFLHYSEMKRDHEGSIRRIANFIGVDPSPEEWTRILEFTSFDWMKRHEDRFEVTHAAHVPVLKRGAMIRKGQSGKAVEDGMTDAIAAELRAVGEEMVADKAALRWFYEGGELNRD